MPTKQYEYDVALSYASEDRSYADALANILLHREVKVFYDEYERATLWGKNLYTYLSDVYQHKARYCVMFLSQHYAAKLWTNHEREAAQARAFSENEEYILPVRLDDTKIPGILPTVAYLSWPPETAETIADAILEKLVRPSTSESAPPNESQPAKRGISRRTIIVWLVAMGTAAGGGTLFALASSTHKHTMSMPTTPPPSPGTTLLTYRGHLYYIWSVAWSPDAKHIASGSVDRTVQVWDAINGKKVFTYYGHMGAQYGVFTVAWSPDGKHIASGGGDGDSTVQIWDGISGDHVLTYRGHSHGIHKLAWSPDGKHIVSGSFDNTAQVWNASTADHILTYRGHSDVVYWVDWSPDGKHIVSGSRDKTVQVWDASTGEKVLTYRGHSSSVDTVAWSPDGRRIASGGGDSTVQVWDASTGDHGLTYRGHAIEVHSVAWSPNGKRIASGSFDHTVQVWDASTGGNFLTYRGHSEPIFDAAWSPDGRRIASGSLDNTVQVWQAD